MTKCSGLPPYSEHLLQCNRSARPFADNSPTNSSCVDWHAYYTPGPSVSYVSPFSRPVTARDIRVTVREPDSTARDTIVTARDAESRSVTS